MPRAIVVDIEGTTSSLTFVHDVLFPYSRIRIADYVRAHADELTAILDAVGVDLDLDARIARLIEWHDEDRKIAPLKDVQALIWAEGFRAGAFAGHVYPDAADGLRRWHAAGIALYVYSSGSVAAQKLLFGHSDQGDLTPLFAGHFDTAIGAKRNAASYRAIAAAIDLPPQEILFLSDVADELIAAEAAGFSAILVVRDGEPASGDFPVVRTFNDVAKAMATA